MKLGKIILAAVLMSAAGGASAQKTMSGRVYDNNREPLMGVLISVEGSNIITLTASDGSYTITVPKGYERNNVNFQYAGFLPQSVLATDGKTDIFFEKEVIKEFEDVFISTQKRLQSSVEVPIAVSVIDQPKLDEINTIQIDDVSGIAPGFNAIIQGQNKGDFSIRGVTSDGLESFFQPRISVFINGVSSARLQCSILELYDMERIEVVKGPQGTLFGRSAEIGAVHYITKRPQKDTSAALSLNFGGYNQRGAQGMVNFMAGEKFANRFAFSYDYHDGYIKNYAGGKLNGKSAVALRNTMSYFQNDKSTFNLILDYEYDDTPGICFKSKQVAPEGGDGSPFTAAYLNGGKELGVKRHLFGLTMEYNNELNSQFNISNTFGIRGAYSDEYFDGDGCYFQLMYCKEKADALQFSEEFRLNWTNGSNLHGFVGAGAMYENCEHALNINSAQSTLFPVCVAPTLKAKMSELPVKVATNVTETVRQALPLLQSNGLTVSEDMLGMISAELENQLNSRLDSWFESSAAWEKTPDFAGDTKAAIINVLVNSLAQIIGSQEMAQQMVGGFSSQLDGALQELVPLSNIAMNDDYYENQTNYARNFESDVFADFNWNVAGGLYFTLGLRGTYERQKSGYLSTAMTAPIVGTMVYESTNGETVWTSDNYFSWVGRFIANYMINKTNNVYLSFSKGRRPGVVYFNYSADNIVKLRAEEIYNYELGLKGSILKNALSYSLAAYIYNWKHFQSTTSYVTADGAYAYDNNDKGKANSAGVEASMKYYFKRYVTLFADYNYFNGKFSDKDEDGNPQKSAGNRFRLSPDYSFDMGFNVNIPVRNKFDVYFRPNYISKGKMFFDDSNLPELSQEPYGVLNATIGIQFQKKHISYDFALWGKNITNTEYIIDAGNAGQTIGFPTFVAGAPANFGVKLKVGFN
jgi:outer membrane receptor protein involved in Fe transport